MAEHDKPMSCPHEHTTSQEPEGNPPSAGRRRFVTGISCSLPAIATLYHGAVLAAGSSLQCLQKRTGNPYAVPGHTDHLINPPANPGDYITAQVDTRTYTATGYSPITFYWDNRASVQVWRAGATGVSTGATTEAGLDFHVASTYGSQYQTTGTIPHGGNAVAYIDDQGDIRALGNESVARDLPATTSCWTSAVPTP